MISGSWLSAALDQLVPEEKKVRALISQKCSTKVEMMNLNLKVGAVLFLENTVAIHPRSRRRVLPFAEGFPEGHASAALEHKFWIAILAIYCTPVRED